MTGRLTPQDLQPDFEIVSARIVAFVFTPGAGIVCFVKIRHAFLACCLLLVPGTAAQALDRIEIALGDVQGAGWHAQALTLHVDIPAASGLSGEITLGELMLPDPFGSLGAVRVRCDTLLYDSSGVHCRGRMNIARLLGGAVQSDAQIVYEAASGRVQAIMRGLRFADGNFRLDAQLQDGRWRMDAQGRQVGMAAARELLRRILPGFDYTLAGRANLDVQLQGDASGIGAAQFALDSDALDIANASGTQAGERLRLDIAGHGQRRGADWQGDARIALSGGALFVDPLYLEPSSAGAVKLHSRFGWSPAQKHLQLTALTLEHAGVARAQADMRLRLGAAAVIDAVDLELQEAQFPGAYLNYIQPWLHGTIGAALETGGRISGRYRYRAGGEASLRLDLRDVDVADTHQRFGIERLSGSVDWGNDAAPRSSELRWSGGSVYRLALGAAGLTVESRGMQFELREPVRIPVLDGRLLIEDLALSNPGEDSMRWRFDGVLTPVSMEAVCAALDWPRFGGQLSGVIPEVAYADGTLTVGGVLLARAFDGELTVRNLRLEQPFGVVPRLSADLKVDNLDLEALTRTFEFGRIEGRLSGRVDALQMVNWGPVAFDAAFATPQGDRSRHRISQRAVDNLSSIGGGVSGALSRSFLVMFEDFPYDRLGLSCVLENGVCRMGGVAPADGGYYIVKGRFLPPRIDVVGYADRVDWQTLIDRLQAVTLDQAPVVR